MRSGFYFLLPWKNVIYTERQNWVQNQMCILSLCTFLIVYRLWSISISQCTLIIFRNCMLSESLRSMSICSFLKIFNPLEVKKPLTWFRRKNNTSVFMFLYSWKRKWGCTLFSMDLFLDKNLLKASFTYVYI